ncbi:MAG: heavy-metal-associated domain-containing protein, partial [Notoacmeibacter sp.]
MSVTYAIEGMTCGKCRAKVEDALKALSPAASVSLVPPQAVLPDTVSLAHASTALAKIGNYKIIGASTQQAKTIGTTSKSWLQTYYPLLLI